MLKFFSSLLCFAALFIAAFFGARHVSRPHQTEALAPLSDPFQLIHYPLEKKSFVIALIGRNNGAYIQRTLDSVFSQVYENFRVVYIDDASDDGSRDLAADLINNHPSLVRVQQVQNEIPLGHLGNLVRIVKECADEEIVVVLEGEDWLAHEWVLDRLNGYYADPDLWMTYGQALEFPTFERAAAPDGKEVRSHLAGVSHLRSFYSALFKKINEADLVHQGKFFIQGGDLAYMIPMLEMAVGHVHQVSEVLYVSNQLRAAVEDRERRVREEKQVRSLGAYAPLPSLFPKKEEL